MPSVTTTIVLSYDLFQRLEKFIELHHISRSGFVRVALVNEMNKVDKKTAETVSETVPA